MDDATIEPQAEAAGLAVDEMDGFEDRMTAWLEAALAHDRRDHPENVDRWEAAYQTLARRDHDVLVMLNPVMRPALGRRLRHACTG